MDDPRTRSLVVAASQGQVPAIDELVGRHLPRLQAYIRLRMGRELRRREGTQDLVQSVCRELIQHQEDFEYRDEQHFLGWLFTTALFKVRERQRFHAREARAPGREQALDGAEDLAAAHWLTPSREAIGRERLQRVAAALESLPDDYREVIGLARIAGLGHREIAARMQRTEAASRKLLGRALASLGELLGTGTDDSRHAL
ncbi:MAG: sigma-70 family RNA polymerase sigma factor [Planctomycetes bacterium]|nr:sigma-70 family RNA polymerase sigma factor [Planctomycetota bacterium]